MGTYWWSQGDSKEVYLGRFRNSASVSPQGVRMAAAMCAIKSRKIPVITKNIIQYV